MTESVFADIMGRSFPYTYHGIIEVGTLVGGIPSDPNVARGWLETKIKGVTTEEQISRLVAETMTDRGVTADEALDIVNKLKNLNGFKRTVDGQLYYEARQLKAALREAVSVAVAVGKLEMRGWGNTKKWITGFFPEHVFVLEDKLPLFVPGDDGDGGDLAPVKEPTSVLQQFVHTRHGSSIQYQECVEGATFHFTVVSDYLFSDEEWGMIWTTGMMNGLGASRSQGYGTYKVTRWDKDINEAALKRVKAQSLEDEPVVRTSRSRSKAA
jgi:hypothetical protein